MNNFSRATVPLNDRVKLNFIMEITKPSLSLCTYCIVYAVSRRVANFFGWSRFFFWLAAALDPALTFCIKKELFTKIVDDLSYNFGHIFTFLT